MCKSFVQKTDLMVLLGLMKVLSVSTESHKYNTYETKDSQKVCPASQEKRWWSKIRDSRD
jgi:hypothetical protein